MDTAVVDSIEGSGYPLGFQMHTGPDRPQLLGTGTGAATYVVEARKLAVHQKEAVVQEGAGGAKWRLTSDEGKHLKGTDLAPFPLGHFNAGLHGDLMGRIVALAKTRDIAIDDLILDLRNAYYLTGSFFKGDGEGFAEPSSISVKVNSGATADDVNALISDAISASPALAALKTPLTNSFAIYVNGRRRPVETMTPSESDNAPDPFVTYSAPPSPAADGPETAGMIRKTGIEEEGAVQLAPAGTKTRIIRNVNGVSHLVDGDGVTETETWLHMPGMSHFAIQSDERPDGASGPSGLAMLSAGIAFCFMTQLDRYIEHMKYNINGVRLVQYSPYRVSADETQLIGHADPVDTHLFLNGQEADETYETLMRIAARTCYLHATLGSVVDWSLKVEHNGSRIL